MRQMWQLLVLVLLSLGFSGCSKCSRKATEPQPAKTETGEAPVKTPNYNGITVTNVVKQEMVVAKAGKEATDGSSVSVKYNEWVYDPAAPLNQGPKITEAGQEPVVVKIGSGKMIKGFEAGLRGMKVGAKRRLIIPANEAYGEAGVPPRIPPKAMIMIEAEVVGID